MTGPATGLPRTRAAAATGRIRGSWIALTGTGAAASLALALLAAVCAFIAVALPRASLGYRTQVLQQAVRAAPSSQTTVLADANISGAGPHYFSAARLASAGAQLAAGLRRSGLPLAPPGTEWSGMTSGSSLFTVAGQRTPANMGPPQMELLYRSGLGNRTALISGSLPSQVRMHPASGTFQVAVTTATAARFGLRIGSRIRSAGLVLVVTGILRPRDPTSSFWTVDPLALAPRVTQVSVNSSPYWDSAAFVGSAELAAMQRYLTTEPLRGVWSMPLDVRGLTADQAAGLEQTLQAVSYLPVASALSKNLNASAGAAAILGISLSCGLAINTLQPFVASDDAVQRVLSLLFASLVVLAAVVVLLGARLVAEHRRSEFAIRRARGASARQVALAALGGGAVAVLPAVALAVAAAVAITPGAGSPQSWWLAGLITAAALAGPAVLAAWWYRPRRTAQPGTDPAARRRLAAARRWVVDGLLVCGSVGGLALLRRQGLPPPGSTDLFTSAAPVLAAIPIAVIVLRSYPVVMRQLARLASRRRGVAAVVGLARGSVAEQASGMPAFALVLAFAVIAFATMFRGAVGRADVAASWQAAQADAVVIAPAVGPGISSAAEQLMAGVPGAKRSAAVAFSTGTSAQSAQLTAAFVNPAQYAALVATTPGPPFPAAALARPAGAARRRIPALLSVGGGAAGAAALLGPARRLWVQGHQLRLRVVGTVTGIAGLPAGTPFAVLPLWALGGRAPPTTAVAITGPGLDAAALTRVARRAVPGAQVTLRASLLAAIVASPLPHGGSVSFAQGAAAAAAFSLLVLALTLMLSARSRELTMARLGAMGLRPAQSLRVAAVEVLPAVLAAAAGGTVCALLLVPLLGPAVNVAAFTGLPVTVGMRADLLPIAVGVAGLLILAGLMLALQRRMTRSHGLAQQLRAGE